MSQDDLRSVVRALTADGLVDLLSVSAGTGYADRSTSFFVPGDSVPENANGELAGAMGALTGIPVIAAGRILDADIAEYALREQGVGFCGDDPGADRRPWLGSIDIAIRKARTARLFDMATGEIGALSQPGGPLFNIEVSNGGLITFPGGIPLRDESGQVVGAIGVSGSTVDNDHTVAQAGAKALS